MSTPTPEERATAILALNEDPFLIGNVSKVVPDDLWARIVIALRATDAAARNAAASRLEQRAVECEPDGTEPDASRLIAHVLRCEAQIIRQRKTP